MSIKNKVVLPTVLVAGIALSGCGIIKPYEKPKFVEIEPNQTAFVIPLEGKTSDQGQFQSLEFLEKNQVAAKRIQIPRTWYKTGRLSGTGEYKDDVRVIIVDRNPATREWKDKSTFVGESMDSIKFNQGISATAQILEGDDSAKFLYQYAGKKLEDVMSTEIRNKIGSVLLEKYGEKTIDDIRGAKGDIINAVRKEVEPYFKERGITLSNIGYIGDLQYLQADIQEAINKDFKAQQDQKAQATLNKTNEDQSTSELKQAQTRKSAMDTLIEMRELELQAEWIKKWDGKLPQVQSGADGNGFLLNIERDKKE